METIVSITRDDNILPEETSIWSRWGITKQSLTRWAATMAVLATAVAVIIPNVAPPAWLVTPLPSADEQVLQAFKYINEKQLNQQIGGVHCNYKQYILDITQDELFSPDPAAKAKRRTYDYDTQNGGECHFKFIPK
jgi:hypothetical protein